jgi:hypothetical protein
MPEVAEKSVSVVGAVTIPTTTETGVIVSPLVKVPLATCFVAIKAWAQLTTGTATTAVTPRIREGSGVTGALVGGANAETLKAAAGSIEPFRIEVGLPKQNVESVQFTFTLQQAGATGNGTVQQAAIEVEVLNG